MSKTAQRILSNSVVASAFRLVALCSLPQPTATPARSDDGSNVGIGNGPSPNSARSLILEG
jgi:hypothetical protein